jgi:hypothetical protein
LTKSQESFEALLKNVTRAQFLQKLYIEHLKYWGLTDAKEKKNVNKNVSIFEKKSKMLRKTVPHLKKKYCQAHQRMRKNDDK